MVYNLDVFSTTPATETFDVDLNLYDNSGTFGRIEKNGMARISNLTLIAAKPLELNLGGLFILDSVCFQNPETGYKYLISKGMLTDINGFAPNVYKAKEIGKFIVQQDIERLIFKSSYFRLLMTDIYLRPFAEEMKIKFVNDTLKLYYYGLHEISRDIDSLYKLCAKHNLDKSYGDYILQFTTDPRQRFIFYYKDRKGLLLQWCGLNFVIFIITLSIMKLIKFLESRITGVSTTGFFSQMFLKKSITIFTEQGTLVSIAGIFYLNVYISKEYWDYLDLSYFVLAWLFPIFSMIILLLFYLKYKR